MSSVARLKPFTAPFFRKLGVNQKPKIEVLQAAETQAVQPCKFLPGMLDRATSAEKTSDLDKEIVATTTPKQVHAQALQMTLRNVLVYPSGFATWRQCSKYGGTVKLGELAQPITQVSKLRYCVNSVIWRYFGHWMSDAIPSALIAPNDGDLWMPPQPSWGHAKDYLDLFEVSPLDAPLVHAEEMVFYQDFAQGSHKRARYNQLRGRLRAKFGNPDATDYVYIKRGTTGEKRLIAHEDALIDKLVGLNWKILDISSASVTEIQTVICKARVVIGMEGSHLNHAQYSLAPGSSLIILMPHDRFVTVHIARARAKQINTGLVVLETSENGQYLVNLDEVLQTIELCDIVP